jgi:hypothetical protein
MHVGKALFVPLSEIAIRIPALFESIVTARSRECQVCVGAA